MFGIFASFLLVKAIIIVLIAIWAHLHAALIVLMAIGSILEGITSVLMEDSDNLVAKEIMYYGGLLLQIVSVFILTIPMFALPPEEINFMMASAIGLVCITIVIGWFLMGFEGFGFHYLYYAVLFIFFIVEGILFAIIHTFPLLVLNTVIACISVVVIICARIKMGSNLE